MVNIYFKLGTTVIIETNIKPNSETKLRIAILRILIPTKYNFSNRKLNKKLLQPFIIIKTPLFLPQLFSTVSDFYNIL